MAQRLIEIAAEDDLSDWQRLQLLPDELRAAHVTMLVRAHGIGIIEQVAAGWQSVRRPSQVTPDGDWATWLLLAGRGFGKSRTGAEWVRECIMDGSATQILCVAPTHAQGEEVIIDQPGSGLLAVLADRGAVKNHKQPRVTCTNPQGDAVNIFVHSAEQPDRIRGSGYHIAWCDEVASWRYVFRRPSPENAFMQAQTSLRRKRPGGKRNQILVSTTPRPLPLIRQLRDDDSTVMTRGSTYANLPNLGTSYDQVISTYDGTRLGRQELHAEILEEAEGALWTVAGIEQHRVTPGDAPAMRRVVIGVDPSGSETGSECGIVAAGLGDDGHFYVIEDRSVRGRPERWAAAVAEMFVRLDADAVIAESNYGGDMVRATLQAAHPDLPVRMVGASRGKQARAEPVSLLAEQGRVHHVGHFAKLEDQMVSWEPDTGADSPDRLDAAVWAIWDLKQRARTGGDGFGSIAAQSRHRVR